MQKEKSLYEIISSAVVYGELPRDFSLPRISDGENEIIFADGAWDGVGIYHMGHSGMSDEDKVLMIDAIKAAAHKKYDKADDLFLKLGDKARALFSIDELQSYIIDNQKDLNAGNVYEYAVHLLLDSTDRECVKFGLSLLELFDTDNNEELKNIIRTVGLSDEFTIFSVFVMLRWEDGNNEVWKLAQKVHGWGRVHAVERIEPETEEIRHWILTEGVHNDVMPAYLALTCWQKSGAEGKLSGRLTKDEFNGIRDIVEGLLDEGPVPGISEVEDADSKIIMFLKAAKEFPLELDDYEVIREIRLHYEDEDSENAEIVALCQELLATSGCRTTVLEALKFGRAVGLAQDLKLEYKNIILQVMEEDFEGKNHLCGLLIDDPEYHDKVITVFRQKLPLAEMKTKPTKTLGLGHDYWKQSAMEFLLQELREYPFEGEDFVETALQSAPIRTRNSGLYVLERWVADKESPLSELLPEFNKLLVELAEIEPDENVKNRMNRLLSGAISFNDTEDSEEE